MRVAASRWVGLLALAGSAFCSVAAASAATRIYGIERQVQDRHERILVFADGQLTPRYEEHEKGSAELVLEGATLDPSAPRRLDLPGGGSFLEVSVREQRGDAQRVVIQIRHVAGVTPRLVEHGSLLALELPRRDDERTGGLDLAGRDMQLREVVTRIARHTGTPVIFDETLQGNVTIMAQQPFSSGEALLLLDTLLLMKGMAAMPSPGGVRKIVRIEGAAYPFITDLAVARGDEAITTLLPLHSIQAEHVLQALRPMLGPNMLAFAYAPTNSLILGGSANLLTRIANIVLALDAKGVDRLFLRPLRHADAETTARQVEAGFADDGLIAVWPDTRTNGVAVRAKAESVPAIRDFLAKLDRPAPARGHLHVIPVDHADPERLAEILTALQSGDAGRIASARGGAVDPITGARALAGREFAVVVDPPTHSLVVQADAETAGVMAEVIAELDRIPRQVDVELTVIELTTSHGVDLSFDFLLPLTDVDSAEDPIAFVAGLPSGPSSLFAGTPVEQTIAPLVGLPPVDKALLARIAREPVLVPLVVNGQVVPVAIPRETAAITAQDQDIYTRIILRPRLTVISGEEHEIFIGDNVPILTEQANTTGDPLLTSQNVERQDVGVLLRVKPTLGEKGGITLELTAEVSALAPSIGNANNLGPTIRERTLTTTARLDHDQVAVIGWHAGPASMTVDVGTPWMRDLPFFGWLFRSNQRVDLESNLVIMVSAWRDDPEVRALADMFAREFDREVPAIAAPAGQNRPTLEP